MKKSLIILLVAAIVLAMSLGVIVFAASTDGIDNSQILVSKEYFDNELSKLKKQISSSGNEYIVLEQLPNGTVVIGGASCEMILRSGAAKAYIPTTAGGGLSDLTAGSNISNGKTITANHLLLFPRDDGRALQVTKDGTYIMVKGDYVLQ